MIRINKPKYIRKYDFQRYFYRPKEQWFLPTSLITDTLKALTKEEYERAHSNYVEDEDEDGSEEGGEFDAYERFKEEKELLIQEKKMDMDTTDPKVYEGNIIDKESKKFMIDNYPECEVYDFDEHKEFVFDVESAAKKTSELLQSHENIIMFQPTFIYKDKAMARPDGFVKIGDMFTLLETKGTTSVKSVHLVDMTYQTIIINKTINSLFNKNIDTFKLCIVDYTKELKHQIGLKMTEFCSLSKSSSNLSKNQVENLVKYSDEYIEARAELKDCSKKGIKIEDYIYNKVERPNKKFENFDAYRRMCDEFEFDQIIDELYEASIDINPTFKPSDRLFCWFKNNEYIPELKAYYAYNPNYFMLHYSGYLLKLKDAIYLYNFGAGIEMVENEISKNNAGRNYLNLCRKHNFSMGGYSPFTVSMFNNFNAHKKKVYFDFESINLATRVIDDTLPFMQTCNQVSVIFDHGDRDLSQSNNVVLDPLTFNLDSYKEIIDAIMPFPNDLKKCDEYIYIVYNKSFECSRLNEMKSLFYAAGVDYANEYGTKCDIIVRNIFDLADFFDVRKDCGIAIEKIHGFYSIKKVLPIVSELYPEIFDEVGCKDYKRLSQIQNGSEAQKETTKRFFNLLSEESWNQTVTNLKIYCENDVRAMVAVEYMVERILKENN